MEITPTIITIGLAIIAFIVWLVRLEGKAGQSAKDVFKLQEHVEDRSIHHDSEWLKQQFADIKASVETVNQTIRDILTKALTK
jgi:hypothetical protein